MIIYLYRNLCLRSMLFLSAEFSLFFPVSENDVRMINLEISGKAETDDRIT